MRLYKLFLVLLIIDLPFIQPVFDHEFKAISCEASEKKTCGKTFCFLTTSEKSLSSVSFGCTLTRPISTGKFSFQQFYKSGKDYRQILKTPALDWNKVLTGKKLNPFLNIIVNMMKKTVPIVARKFPWTGNFTGNLSLEDHKYFSIFPKGDYKTLVWFGDDDDEYIFKMTLIATLTTSVEVRN